MDMSNNKKFITYSPQNFSEKEMIERAQQFYEFMDQRRSIRDFSDRDVPEEVIKNLIKTASSAPSGAHKQPWTFCVIRNQEMKKKIREAAEKEEYESYHNRMSEQWLEDLKPLETDWNKPFLETVPWIIVVMKKVYDLDENEDKKTNYYVNESVGLACGFLLTAIHNAGLVSLTHTPSPMNFLTELLDRPKNERPFLLIPIGYPAEGTQVPDLKRKSLNDVTQFYI